MKKLKEILLIISAVVFLMATFCIIMKLMLHYFGGQ